MKLHTAKGTPNHRRVSVFLAEKGIELPEIVEVDLRGAENLSDAYRAKNPFGRIPLLELDDGTFLAESLAICRYFEGLQPEPSLFGTTPLEQATIEMWTRRVELGLMMPVAQAFRNLSGIFKDRETCVREWGEVAAQTARDAVPLFEGRLTESPWLAGERFTVADVTLGITMEFARATKQELPYDLTHIAGFMDAVKSRPGFAAG